MILEFFVQNYMWILIGFIIILLAVIGYYADKTNFGQGKMSGDQNLKNSIDEQQNANTSEIIENNGEVPNIENLNYNNDIQDGQETKEVENFEQNQINEPIIEYNEENSLQENAELNSEQDLSIATAEKNFDEFNDEFNSILPQKDFLNTDLLGDIESLDTDFDKTKKIDLDMSKLTDIELPKIKQLTESEEDIWKF